MIFVILIKQRKIYYWSLMFFRLHFKFQDQCDCPQMLPARKASLSLPQLLFSFLIKMFQMGGFLLSFYFLLLILANATQTLSIPFIVYVGAVQLWACYQSWLYLSAKCFRNSFQPSSRFLTLFSFQKEDCFQVQNWPWNIKKSVLYKVYLRPCFLLKQMSPAASMICWGGVH